MVRVRWLPLFALVVVAAFACEGVDTGAGAIESPTPAGDDDDDAIGDDDDDDGSPPPTNTPNATPTPAGGGEEIEPNGNETQATYLGGSGSKSFSGTCADGLDDDIFKVDAGAGTLSATLTWNEGAAGEDLDLYLYDYDLWVFNWDDATPPGDSPIALQLALDQPYEIYVAVVCWGPSPNVPYSGTLVVP